jgi:hypothetical protein
MLVNTHLFQEDANRFRKEGAYCRFVKGSYPHREYWMEQDRRCREGHTIGGLYIPGTYYFYLNFYPILRKDEATGRKKFDFPQFTDVDLEYFTIIEQAREQKKGVVFSKPRRTGFSYKNSSLAVHEYNFYRDAKCIIGAFDSKYSDFTMGLALEGLNFLDKHTEWKKERNPDTKTFVKARFKEKSDGIEVWKGYNSEIFTLTFQNNPFASVGKSSNIFIFEEAGKFDNIIQSYNISEPCWKDGDDMIGIPIVFGTGGDMEGGTLEFSEMFYNPEKYNLLAFENIWDDELHGTKCGWFVPASRMRFGTYTDKEGKTYELVDKNGNSNVKMAEQSILDFRATKEKGSDPQAMRDAVTQYPLTTKESFLRSNSNMFPVADLSDHLGNVQANTQKYLDPHHVVELIQKEDGTIVHSYDIRHKPIYEFPPNADDIHGTPLLFQMPYKDENDEVPYGRYIAGIDPYDQDQSSTKSLGSMFVMDRVTDRIVAEYTGRPETAHKFYEICRRLLIFYNARANYENNLTGLFDYFMTKNSLHLLAEEPLSVRDVIQDHAKRNKKGTRATESINKYGRELIKQWLIEVIDEEEGRMNLHTITSPALLQELIYWSIDGNYDRVSAMGMLMLIKQDYFRIVADEQSRAKDISQDPFWKRHRKHHNPNQLFNVNNYFKTIDKDVNSNA